MTKNTIAQAEPVLVAFDIAKARHEVLLAVPGKKRRRRLTVLNRLDDFTRLIAILSGYNHPVRAAFEATGNYHRALAYRLGAAGFDVKLVSSVALARTREALNNSWDKNDPKDAQVILHMMQIGNEQFYHAPMLCGTNDLQELSKTHDIVSRSKTELWHRILTHYLPLYWPEAERFHRSSRKFCGMDLATIQSGTFRGQTKLSKYGNARLRRTLWMAGQVAIMQKTNSFRDKFERYIAKDRHNTHLRRKAYTAIAAKMARTVHGIIKRGEAYRPFFEG